MHSCKSHNVLLAVVVIISVAVAVAVAIAVAEVSLVGFISLLYAMVVFEDKTVAANNAAMLNKYIFASMNYLYEQRSKYSIAVTQGPRRFKYSPCSSDVAYSENQKRTFYYRSLYNDVTLNQCIII